MKVQVVTVLATTSLLFAAILATEWPRSYSTLDYVTFDGTIVFVTYHGSLRIWVQDSGGSSPLVQFAQEDIYSDWVNPELDTSANTRRCLGFSCGAIAFSNVNFIGVPLWFILLALSGLPAIRGYRVVQRRRKLKLGHCIRCGYDLRATPDRCPECGAVAIKK